MALQVSGQSLKTGAAGQSFPQDQQQALVVSELNPRNYLNAYAGNVYSASTAGGGLATAATQLFSTAIATFTPILALYNPITNNKNFAIENIWCGLSAAPVLTATQTGAYLLVVNSGQSITNAQTATPVNHLTFKASGSSAIGITGVALTGAVGNPIVLRPMTSTIELVTATANASAVTGTIDIEDIGGAIIIPPGGYLGIAMGISNAVAGHLTTAGFTWAEIPV
jgi:hypothetical protein